MFRAAEADGDREEEDDEGVRAKKVFDSNKLDVKILPIWYDEAGERWRQLHDSFGLLDVVDFGDWPLDNLRSTERLVVDLRGANRTFMPPHSDWAEHSGVCGGAFVDPENERYAARRLKEKNELDKELNAKRDEAAARINVGANGGSRKV